MTKDAIQLGDWVAGGRAMISLARLMETRALIQANSGGGKSWKLRRLLEQTAGKVQQIVIDPEGEFATLREKHDLVIAAAHGGDALAHPKTAKILAQRLLETRVSAVLDIYDLKKADREAFVRIFLESLMTVPKHLYGHVLIVLDEAQLFAPEKGSGESQSTSAVIDIATRGRKRGYCLVAATQRISKLNKDVAAELLNKFVGRTGLDLDVKRAAFELGMTPKEALSALQNLNAGEFFCFGPAISTTVQLMKSGSIETRHPKVGDRQLQAPPKPTDAIKAILPKLADLPKEAEAEARSIEELKKENATLRRELKQAAAPAGKPSASPVETGALKVVTADNKKLRVAIEALMKFIVEINAQDFLSKIEGGVDPEALRKPIEAAIAQATKLIDVRLEQRNKEFEKARKAGNRLIEQLKATLGDDITVAVNVKHQEAFKVEAAPERKPSIRAAIGTAEANGQVSASQHKVLNALAWLEAHNIRPAPRETVAAIAGVPHTSGGYKNNCGALRSAGFIDYPEPATIELTPQGAAIARYEDDGKSVHEHWLDVVTNSQRKIMETLIEVHPEAMSRAALAEAIDVPETSGGFKNNLGALRTLKALDYPSPGQVGLTRYVIP